MKPLRLATWNIEWMTTLFDAQDQVIDDDTRSARFGVTKADQTRAIAHVMAALDADGIMIIEAPDTNAKRQTIRALETFARRFGLRQSKAIHGFTSGTEQEIAFLFDPDRISVRHDPFGPPARTSGDYGAPRFDTALRVDLDDDGAYETVRFSKPPLELLAEHAGQKFRLIGVHAKSKSPHGAKNETDMVRLGIDNRRKQLAECHWIRRRVENHLDQAETVIVLGDLNDGPGLDQYEQLFGQSGLEIVLGPVDRPDRQLFDPHAMDRSGHPPVTARFWIAPQDRYLEALLDFIMVPAPLAAHARWEIWHPLRNPKIIPKSDLAAALLTASDHFPVTCDLGFVATGPG